MQATLQIRRAKNQHLKLASKKAALDPGAMRAAEEIHAFLAVRDGLLADAEQSPNESNLHRLWMANEFAERCLEPARPPYQAQALPSVEAARERQRCQTIKKRMAELRSRMRRRAA